MSAFDGLKFNSTGYGQQGRVTNAIANASARTGVDFHYLMSQAKIESSMNPNARAQTSSATGLYQFVDQSWLAIVNNHGAEYGMDWAANAIQKSGGQYYVADPAMRQQILDLRNHPETASAMAAELASDNRDYLEQRIGRQAQPVDLYLAHFLGAAGAAKFLTSPQTMAGASLFPAAARANASIFYDRDGNARSLADIRAGFAQKLEGGSTGGFEGGSTWALPDGTRMVQPADYMRIAQERMAQTSGADPLSGDIGDPQYGSNAAIDGDAMLLNDVQALTLGRAVNAATAQPRAETARLAYLMLATLGR
ncbi:MAG: lytic transglycosylase domain-containing protein [Sphingobium sp.]|nr:lytic transglycosylase domain-containing protein [Sphingobium sp.]